MSSESGSIKAKSHYEILDGLRGVAAMIVVIFHSLEVYSGGDRFLLRINHGYLAVDFFFLLSGFVISYAYDDRWDKMTQWDFYKRRLIRLQPMVIMGSIVGAVLFYFQASDMFPLISDTPLWQMLLVMLVGFTLIPITPSMDVRGWQEMHPLNGPAWSLFFEYIANILYALFIRKFSTKVLSVCVFLSACWLIQYTTMGGQGDVVGGWALDQTNMKIGFVRVLFPFLAGILLCRLGKVITVKGGFWLCSLMIVTIFFIPRLGGNENLWMNGLFESFSIILVFPLVVAIGAGSMIEGKTSKNICLFLGRISYPLYITHYPLMYVYMAWVDNNHVSIEEGWPMAMLCVVVSILLAYLFLRFFDEPVRNWLKKFQ